MDSDALKILFVDDEPDLVPLIQQKFRRKVRQGEVELTFASDGQDALDKIDENTSIEVVVTDINMPRMDGLTLLGKLGERGHRVKAVVVTAYGDMENIRTAMNRGAFDFLTKPIDMNDLEITLRQARAAVERDREADRVRAAFGRYLSDDIAKALLEHPDALALGGEEREVSVLMSDLSGFSQLAERLPPDRVVALLNIYLSAMTDVADTYGGAIDEFIGDAVLAIFGAPLARPDHAERAVACAVAMQRAMTDVNEKLGELGLPPMQMTAAVNTGDVVVGSIGSEKRAKYGVVGSPVNLTSRIQSLAAPGEVLISDMTYRATGGADGPVQIRETRQATLKGYAEPIDIHCLQGIGGDYGLEVPDAESVLAELDAAVPVTVSLLDDKQVSETGWSGTITSASAVEALAQVDGPVPARSNVCVTFDASGNGRTDAYAKVIDVDGADGRTTVRLRFAALPPEAAALLLPTA